MNKKVFNIKTLYLLLIFLFAIPSIIHIKNSGFVLQGKEYFHIFINDGALYNNNFINGILYFAFFAIMFAIYFVFLKKRKKLFGNIKGLLLFVILASFLFAIILPITSSDIFSYATTGEIQSRYGANPYYDTISKIKGNYDTSDNQILNAITIWDNQLVIYGPLWSLICAIITFLSFSNVSLALILFKVFAIAIHIGTCVLIYKITHKKFWVILYVLNPYILFETISNVHNDLYLVFFTILALYFFIKKKNLLMTLIFLACATTIKYLTVLLVPLLLIYYYRNETIGKRILKCIKSGLLCTFLVILLYFIYLRDIETIFYVFIQQNKYRESLLATILVFSYKAKCLDITAFTQNIISVCYIILYILLVVKLLLTTNIKFENIMNKWNVLILTFILVYITNLCVWYFVWLFTAVIWQNKTYTKITLFLPFIYELLISKYFFLGGEWASETYWFSIVAIICTFGIVNLNKLKDIKLFE